ncbi:TetR/AcrR family transcriptional regulator [Kineococcus sp. SYSU DK006]|uniref:TetR/AcrR family transcriptional regulator n=1 Tax=Kineococcus sp. SYSU DK006 TaxID=3383127 RepID=UPI003D7C3D3D
MDDRGRDHRPYDALTPTHSLTRHQQQPEALSWRHRSARHPPDASHHGQGGCERTREAIRAELSAAAISTFEQHGFAATTAEVISARVGVSRRAFFSYIASTVDAVLQPMERLSATAAERWSQRPAGEGVLQALPQPRRRRGGGPGRPGVDAHRHCPQPLRPELRRRDLQQHDAWIDQLCLVVARRTRRAEGSASARLPCAVVLAALEKALTACAGGDDFSRIGQQFDDALIEVERLFHP